MCENSRGDRKESFKTCTTHTPPAYFLGDHCKVVVCWLHLIYRSCLRPVFSRSQVDGKGMEKGIPAQNAPTIIKVGEFFVFSVVILLQNWKKWPLRKGDKKKRRSDGATPTSPKSKIIIWTGKGRISKAALQLGGSPLPRSRRLSGSLCCSGGLDEGRQRVTTLVKLWDIIATSDEVTQRGGGCKGNPLISGKSRLVNYYNWPDYCSQWFLVLPAVVAPPATQVVRTGWQEPPGSSNVPSEVANTRFVPNHITLNDPIQIMFFELLVILVTRCSSSSKSADDLMQVHGFLKAAGLNEEARLAAFSHCSSKREL